MAHQPFLFFYSLTPIIKLQTNDIKGVKWPTYSCTVVAALAMVASLGIKVKVPKKATRDAGDTSRVYAVLSQYSPSEASS